MKTFRSAIDLRHLAALILMLALLMSLAGCSSGTADTSARTEEPAPAEETLSPTQQAEMQLMEELNAMLSNTDRSSVVGNMALTVVIDSDTNESYVSLEETPESLRTEDFSQVRYLIRQYRDKEIVGQYSGGSAIGGMAYKLRYVIEIIDMKLNGVLDYAEFYGSEPPETITTNAQGFGNGYGEPPSQDEMNAWVLQTIENGTFIGGGQTVRVQVPEGWGVPFVEYRDYKNPIRKFSITPMILDGEWYTIIVPKWVDTLSVHSFEDGHPYTNDTLKMWECDLNIVVTDLEGNFEFTYADPEIDEHEKGKS